MPLEPSMITSLTRLDLDFVDIDDDADEELADGQNVGKNDYKSQSSKKEVDRSRCVEGLSKSCTGDVMFGNSHVVHKNAKDYGYIKRQSNSFNDEVILDTKEVVGPLSKSLIYQKPERTCCMSIFTNCACDQDDVLTQKQRLDDAICKSKMRLDLQTDVELVDLPILTPDSKNAYNVLIAKRNEAKTNLKKHLDILNGDEDFIQVLDEPRDDPSPKHHLEIEPTISDDQILEVLSRTSSSPGSGETRPRSLDVTGKLPSFSSTSVQNRSSDRSWSISDASMDELEYDDENLPMPRGSELMKRSISGLCDEDLLIEGKF